LPDAVGSPRILPDVNGSPHTSPNGMETVGEGERRGGAGERSSDDGEVPLGAAAAAIAIVSILPVVAAVAGWPLLSASVLINLVSVRLIKKLERVTRRRGRLVTTWCDTNPQSIPREQKKKSAPRNQSRP
jgi:hypothetical protein